MPLLDIRNLTIEFMTPDGPVKAVDRVSITLNEGDNVEFELYVNEKGYQAHKVVKL